MNLENQAEASMNPFELAKNKSANASEEVETQDAETKETEEKSIYLGSKKFSSVDELAKYTAQLEQERTQFAPQEQPAQTKSKKVSELLFEDPDQALEMHEKQIIEKIRAQDQAKNAEKQLWDNFYSKNKDLSEEKDLVEFALGKHWPELKSLHPEQALEKLADYTRKVAVRFRKTEGQKQELPSGQAKTGLGTSYTPTQIPEKREAPVDFVSQLKKIQSKRK